MPLEIYKPKLPENYETPNSDNTGFASPASDYMERPLDLNDLFLANPTKTYYIKVTGDKYSDYNVDSGDILVVDNSLEPVRGKLVIQSSYLAIFSGLLYPG